MNKISNDENIKNLKKRKVLRIIIIIFCILTIASCILSLIIGLNLLVPIALFIITKVLISVREKTVINKKDDLKYYRKVLKNSKKK